MTLASMLALDKTALVCDLAETYGIYDYRSLPVSTVATLSAGLRETSRIKMKMRGDKHSQETMLLASIADSVNGILWCQGALKEKPPSFVDGLINGPRREIQAFASIEAFEEARSRYIRG